MQWIQEEICHIPRHKAHQINNLGDIFGGQTIFYELISFHLIETILNVYEETIKEHTIISLNEFFLNHFKELISSAIKFKSVYQVFRQNFRKWLLEYRNIESNWTKSWNCLSRPKAFSKIIKIFVLFEEIFTNLFNIFIE